MSRKICLFGELDAYSNSIPQSIKALPALIKQLKIACLLYDEVIVNTNVLLEHALTLPAFQALSYFTRAGILWTSAVENQGKPEDYIMKRAKKFYGDNLNRGISRYGADRLSHIIENWQSISPSTWRVVRKVSHQQKNATSNIIYNLQRIPFLSKQGVEAKTNLLDLVGSMQDQRIFNRNEMIARLGGMREQITREELSQFAFIIQGEYMNQGAHNKGDIHISLFPGKYIKQLKQNSHLFQAQSLPVDLDILEKANFRLHNSSFPLEKLTKLSQKDLFSLSQSSDWKIWRNYILSNNFSFESIKEMNSLYKSYQKVGKILSILLKNIDVPYNVASPTPLLLPTPWILSGLGLMGTTTEIKQYKKIDKIILNLNSRELKYKNHSIILEKTHAVLLSLFASTGNVGLPIESIKQLDVEIDLIKRPYRENTWRAQKDDEKQLDIGRLNRINVAKNRLNKKLKPLGIVIKITTDKGIWKIVSSKNMSNLQINLKDNTSYLEKKHTKTPENLTNMQKIIWKFFISRYSSFITAHAIAIEINAPEKSVKQISDIMYKFKNKLNNTPFQLIQSYQGDYMIINKCRE